MTSVVIADYGLGNLFNLQRALESVGAQCRFASDAAGITNAERLILPGVGAFGAGMQNLKERGLFDAIRSYAAAGKPLLGICLGMQLLFTQSEELGVWDGLAIVPGKVRRLAPQHPACKVPHIGWCGLDIQEKDQACSPLLRGVSKKAAVYFVHSYCIDAAQPESVAALTHYGSDSFCSVVSKHNVHGCQFHPERSAQAGITILKNFMAL